MAPASRIAELATLIGTHTSIVDDHLSSNGLPSPSFDVSMPTQLLLPEAIASSSRMAIEASNELHSLLLGPVGFLIHQIDGPVKPNVWR